MEKEKSADDYKSATAFQAESDTTQEGEAGMDARFGHVYGSERSHLRYREDRAAERQRRNGICGFRTVGGRREPEPIQHDPEWRLLGRDNGLDDQ